MYLQGLNIKRILANNLILGYRRVRQSESQKTPNGFGIICDDLGEV
jgi:hypothetical protein